MSWNENPDTINRTAKLLVDSKACNSPREAINFLETLVLQVSVGDDIGDDTAAQAALLTIVNAGHRAFLGGINVAISKNVQLRVPWGFGLNVADAVNLFGGTVVKSLNPNKPTLAVARPEDPIGKPVLHITYSGWSGGVVQKFDHVLKNSGIVPAGVAAGALGISEVFQNALGEPVASRRDIGISLWNPLCNWRDENAVGPALEFLPSKIWLLGLGHLGQAYSWVLGMLPYENPKETHVGLIDFDKVVKGNIATQLLVNGSDNVIDRRKTRVVASALESLRFETTIVERAFDSTFRLDRTRNEPTVALSGFDKRSPRLDLGNGGFLRVVDGGLGSGYSNYLGITTHTFPAIQGPAEAFPERSLASPVLSNAYENEIDNLIREGGKEDAVRCGMLEIAGVNVGAAFVGAFAGSLVISDLLRILHDGPNFSVVSVDLQCADNVQASVIPWDLNSTFAFSRALTL